MAMMGSAKAGGPDRARVAAEQAVACPLLEDINISDARGVLVNITATASLKMKETRIVMDTIRSFAADDATVIFGTVCDESMGDNLRVTVVATGLGRAAKRAPLTVVANALRTGTDNAPIAPANGNGGRSSASDYTHLDTPAVWRTGGRDAAVARVAALEDAGADRLDIPAFLRKQAD